MSLTYMLIVRKKEYTGFVANIKIRVATHSKSILWLLTRFIETIEIFLDVTYIITITFRPWMFFRCTIYWEKEELFVHQYCKIIKMQNLQKMHSLAKKRGSSFIKMFTITIVYNYSFLLTNMGEICNIVI